MFERKQLYSAHFLVGLAGAQICAFDKDGKVLWEIGLPLGVHDAEKYLHLVKASDLLKLEGNAVLQGKGRRIASQDLGERMFQSGANPDFRPTSYTDGEVRLRRMLDQTDRAEKRLAKRIRALERVKAGPDVLDDQDQGNHLVNSQVQTPQPTENKPKKSKKVEQNEQEIENDDQE